MQVTVMVMVIYFCHGGKVDWGPQVRLLGVPTVMLLGINCAVIGRWGHASSGLWAEQN